MARRFRGSFLNFRAFLFAVGGCAIQASAQPLPAAIFKDLSAEKFADRETAQASLLDWARKQPPKVVDELHRQSLIAPDPEVRVRCLAALKELVLEREFFGEGYLGISMIEIDARIPGDKQVRKAIQIGMVLPETAAGKAGLVANDLIVALGDRVWREEGMAADFSKIIREKRPGTKVSLLLLKDQKLVTKEIVLGTKPEPEGDGEAPPKLTARDQFFQRWLDKREARRR